MYLGMDRVCTGEKVMGGFLRLCSERPAQKVSGVIFFQLAKPTTRNQPKPWLSHCNSSRSSNLPRNLHKSFSQLQKIIPVLSRDITSMYSYVQGEDCGYILAELRNTIPLDLREDCISLTRFSGWWAGHSLRSF